MRRLAALDRALLVGVGALWLVAFASLLLQVARGPVGWVPLYFEPGAAPDALPTVTRPWEGGDVRAAGIQPGDRIAAVGGKSAQGLGRAALIAAMFARAENDGRVPLDLERGGARVATLLPLVREKVPWLTALLSAAFAAIGLLAFRRGTASAALRGFFVATLSYALHWCAFASSSPEQTRIAIALSFLSPALTGPAAIRTLLLFPEEVAQRGPLARAWPWLFALNGVFVLSWAFGLGLPPALGRPLALAGNVALIATMLFLLAHQYRRSGASGRRQLRWAALGFYLGLTPPLVFSAVAAAAPNLLWAYHVSLCGVVAIPICLFIGLDRHHLLDVDRLIGATATYSLLIGVAIAGLLAAAPTAARALAGVASLDPATSQALLGVVAAVLIVPAQRALRPRVEQLLFRERHALEAGVGALRSELGRCEKPEEVFEKLGARLCELLHPDCLAIYGHAADAFAPLFASGRAIAPAFDASGRLPALLEQTGEPLDAARLRGRGRRGLLAPGELAALDAMGVQLVVPLLLEEALVAFVCFGEKESGDIYTETDRALLQALGDRVGAELHRFGELATRSEERAMMDRLRRYVPGAVADELASGGALEDGEREVSVLFVDVRGYTSYAEHRGASEIFASVNRYTETVSEVVRRHGGSVVEFNGDGMMAVFGAPRPLPRKEESAVAAACEIAERVGALDFEGARLSVGVGVASGPAYVGSVRAVDRDIWSALGNTTNLAARLEKLTRELDAAVAVDGATWAAAGSAARGFEPRPAQRVRGRSEPVDVHVLPLGSG